MSWIAKPYISKIRYLPQYNDTMIFSEGTDNRFFSSLTSIMFNRDDVTVANITTSLRVTTSGLDNGTNITCVTYRGIKRSQSSSVLYFVGMYKVKPLLADTPNSGHLLYSGQCAMYQVLFTFIPYLRNLRLADTS